MAITAMHRHALSASPASFDLRNLALHPGELLVPVQGPLPPVGTFDVFSGTSGNNTKNGTNNADLFNYSQGGNDTLNGLGGGDTFNMGAAFNADDKIDGGSGADGMLLDGDYSAGVIFNATTLVNVEEIVLTHGHNYKLTLNGATVAPGSAFTIDGSDLGLLDGLTVGGLVGAGRTLHLTGGHGNDNLRDGQGDDTLTGGDGQDVLNIGDGGEDIAYGGNGNDSFVVWSEFDLGDTIDGGAGIDTLTLDGNSYSDDFPLVLGASTLTNVEEIDLVNGPLSYNVVLNAATVAAGQTMTVDASGLDFESSVYIDGSALDAASSLIYFASAGDNDAFGGAGNDTFYGGTGPSGFYGGAGDDRFFGNGHETDVQTGTGTDTVFGGSEDTFIVADELTAADRLFGGAGYDQVEIAVDTAVACSKNTLVSIEEFDLTSTATISLTLAENAVDTGVRCLVDYEGDHAFHFDGSHETNGSFLVLASVEADKVTGGAGGDEIFGLAGKDILTGNGGADLFGYFHVADSTGTAHDTIRDFSPGADVFYFQDALAGSGVDAKVTTGKLSSAKFDANLASAIGGALLAAHHAVVFIPSGGTLMGDIFLIVDGNGTAGYQAGADYVIELRGPVDVDAITTSNFVHTYAT